MIILIPYHEPLTVCSQTAFRKPQNYTCRVTWSFLFQNVPEVPLPEVFTIWAKTANMGINFRPENSKLISNPRFSCMPQPTILILSLQCHKMLDDKKLDNLLHSPRCYSRCHNFKWDVHNQNLKPQEKSSRRKLGNPFLRQSKLNKPPPWARPLLSCSLEDSQTAP